MTNKSIIDVNLDGLPRPLAAAVRYLADLSWSQTTDTFASLPVSEAARMLGVPHSTLNLWCRQGKVRARKFGKAWIVDVEDCREYLISKSIGG